MKWNLAWVLILGVCLAPPVARATTPDLLSAQQLAKQGHCDQAVDLFRKALKTDRRDREARLGLADCLTTLGRADEALKEIEPGLDDNATWRPRFLVARGRARMAKQDLRDAG